VVGGLQGTWRVLEGVRVDLYLYVFVINVVCEARLCDTIELCGFSFVL